MFNCFLSLFISVEVSDSYVKGLSIIIFFPVNLNFIYLSFLLIFLLSLFFIFILKQRERKWGPLQNIRYIIMKQRINNVRIKHLQIKQKTVNCKCKWTSEKRIKYKYKYLRTLSPLMIKIIYNESIYFSFSVNTWLPPCCLHLFPLFSWFHL
jgi:hypothetical protein